MTQDQHAAAVAYVGNCYDLDPDCPTFSRAREYCEDNGIDYTVDDLEQISFEAVFERV